MLLKSDNTPCETGPLGGSFYGDGETEARAEVVAADAVVLDTDGHLVTRISRHGDVDIDLPKAGVSRREARILDPLAVGRVAAQNRPTVVHETTPDRHAGRLRRGGEVGRAGSSGAIGGGGVPSPPAGAGEPDEASA